MTNLEKCAFNFKSLLDAIRIRNHVIEMFERADLEPDRAQRSSLLTFVIAGGGFAGVELAGALNDFAHGILADYPRLRANELNIVLVHSHDRVLPELSESLARYAQEKMELRGVTFRLNTRLVDARPGVVRLSDGEIRTETLVWTAGTAPNPLLKALPLEKDKRGAVVVDSTLAVPGQAGLWAVGDCAAVTDGRSGRPCPPTAQCAQRQAELLASNMMAQLRGRPARRFHFDSAGALCVVGHQTACAELAIPFVRNKSIRFSGLFAWLLWRGIYLAKLRGLERKIRVLVMIAEARGIASIPDKLTSVEAAPLLCAGVTTYNALRNAGLRGGDLVAVQGIGGLGHLGVQFARHMGFHTVAVGRGVIRKSSRKNWVHICM
jgi:NADH dehydrogenase